MIPTLDLGHHVMGVEEMDEDHRKFLALLGILNDAGDTEFPVMFQKLVDHIRLHFVREGRLMRLEQFPLLGEHEGEHYRVLGELLQFNRAVKRGRLSLARAYVRLGLPEWFELHLSTMDSALAAHIKVHAKHQSVLRALQA